MVEPFGIAAKWISSLFWYGRHGVINPRVISFTSPFGLGLKVFTHHPYPTLPIVLLDSSVKCFEARSLFVLSATSRAV